MIKANRVRGVGLSTTVTAAGMVITPGPGTPYWVEA